MTEGGSYWTQTSAPQGRWYSIASDSTGQYLAAAQGGYNSIGIPGSIYISSNG